MLEFCALVALRIKEPELVRPFKIPGGIPVAVVVALGPGALFAYALYRSVTNDAVNHTTSIVAGGTCLVVGAIVLVRGRHRLYAPPR